MNALAHSSTTLVCKIDGQPVSLFYNLAAKQRKQAGALLDLAHHSNKEEAESKIIHKEKWPIPISLNFANDKRLFFGSTYPELQIKDDFINLDLTKCQFESLEI
jgi:hypothetical protein